MEKFVKCNLCESDDYKILFPSGSAQINQIVECNSCGLMYSNPRIQEEDCLAIKNYDPNWILTHLDEAGLKQRIEKEKLQVKDYQETKDFINQNYPQKGKLVEVGSGFGFLLDFFKQDGWNVIGIDPNKGLCQYARSQLKLEAFSTTLEEAGLKDNSVDVFLMMHVIEHLPEPLTTFKYIHQLLKSGGLFVLETPRYDTLVFKLLGKRERSLSCNGHIYFFTTKTLEEMAKKAGFKILRSDYVGRSLTLDRLFYNLGVVSKSQKVQKLFQFISKSFHFEKVSFSLNLRDMERVYLKKE
jgi:2-polyprenyl-3-methyl-5-hydroxy-6-metoxy-1,4-benzoquinol methylase